jgi:hypothetical protein
MNHDIKLPSIAATVTVTVGDFDAWKKTFEARAEARKNAGILGHHINRSADDPGVVSVYLPASDRGKLEGFLADMTARMQKSGVSDTPSIALLVPQEDRATRGRALAAAMLSFDVESYDRWKSAFDSGVELRKRGGVVGWAVNRSAANPNRVLVYLQAESAETLRALVTSSELAAGMQKAGVVSAPQITFLHYTGHSAQYAS